MKEIFFQKRVFLNVWLKIPVFGVTQILGVGPQGVLLIFSHFWPGWVTQPHWRLWFMLSVDEVSLQCLRDAVVNDLMLLVRWKNHKHECRWPSGLSCCSSLLHFSHLVLVNTQHKRLQIVLLVICRFAVASIAWQKIGLSSLSMCAVNRVAISDDFGHETSHRCLEHEN